MKLILTFLSGLAIAFAAIAQTPPRKEVRAWAGPGDSMVRAVVIQSVEGGTICNASVTDKYEIATWRGEIFIYGHPKQAAFAEGDPTTAFYALRTGNWKLNGRVLRAYKFVSFPQAENSK